jgi:branched-chain amino acid transport system permease protein
MMSSKKVIIYLLIIVLLFLLPTIIKDSYFLYMAILSGIFVILALSLNVIVGYAGQMSFCHSAFFGVGAYTSAILVMNLKFSFWLALPLAMVAALILAFIIGYPSLRLRGPYFAIVTVGCAEVVRSILYNWVDLTGGPMGLPKIPPPDPIRLGNLFTLTFNTRQSYYYLVLVFVLLTLFIIIKLMKSKAGRAFIAIREDEGFARSIGIDIKGYKILAFAISAIFGGMAGSLYAHYILFISPVSFTIAESINVILMVIIGGMGTMVGPIFGAILLTALPEVLRAVADYRMVLYGLLLMLVMIFLPGGLMAALSAVASLFSKGSGIAAKGGSIVRT